MIIGSEQGKYFRYYPHSGCAGTLTLYCGQTEAESPGILLCPLAVVAAAPEKKKSITSPVTLFLNCLLIIRI
jgi:hypothetical protein